MWRFPVGCLPVKARLIPYSGFFRGEKFSRIDLIQIFEGKIFTNHSTGASVITVITREITRVEIQPSWHGEVV